MYAHHLSMYWTYNDQIIRWNSSGSFLDTGISPPNYYCELIVSCQVHSFSSMLESGQSVSIPK